MNKYILKQEVLDAYDGYVKAFIKGDTKEVENYLSFPNYRFHDGKIKEFNEFHSNLNELKNRGYKDTIALSIDVVEINEEKAIDLSGILSSTDIKKEKIDVSESSLEKSISKTVSF